VQSTGMSLLTLLWCSSDMPAQSSPSTFNYVVQEELWWEAGKWEDGWRVDAQTSSCCHFSKVLGCSQWHQPTVF